MGYLNNQVITVDAILTKKGRELLSRQDGSFNITLTISGTDANNKPYVLVDVNNGTGSIDTSTQSYSGTLSTKAFS